MCWFCLRGLRGSILEAGLSKSTFEVAAVVHGPDLVWVNGRRYWGMGILVLVTSQVGKADVYATLGTALCMGCTGF